MTTPSPAAPAALLLLSLVVCAGCATTTHEVGVDAIAGRGHADLRTTDHRTTTFGVIPSNARGNALLAPDVRDKIESLLESNGYAVVHPDSADVLVLNNFGGGSSRESFRGIVLPSGNMLAAFSAASEQDHPWLMLAVAPAADVRVPGVPPHEVTWLWIAEVTSAREAGELQDALDYMLVAAFEHFGRATGRGAVVRLSEADGRVRRLREVRGLRGYDR